MSVWNSRTIPLASSPRCFSGFPAFPWSPVCSISCANAGVSRLAYGTMILLAVALGLSIVIELAGIDLSGQPPLELAYSLKLLLRAVASFVAAAAFAMLFNSSARTVVATGLLLWRRLRLALTDMGMMLAPAAFFAALVIGLTALLADDCFNVPRMARRWRRSSS
jgi:hypothetical protein